MAGVQRKRDEEREVILLSDLEAVVAESVRRSTAEVVNEILPEIVKALRSEGCQCNPSMCKDQCGITPKEHYESHKRINEFFSDLSDLTRNVRSTLVKIMVTLLVGAAALGFGIKLRDYL